MPFELRKLHSICTVLNLFMQENVVGVLRWNRVFAADDVREFRDPNRPGRLFDLHDCACGLWLHVFDISIYVELLKFDVESFCPGNCDIYWDFDVQTKAFCRRI